MIKILILLLDTSPISYYIVIKYEIGLVFIIILERTFAYAASSCYKTK